MALQCLRRKLSIAIRLKVSCRLKSTGTLHETDSYGIPTRPTWSVNQLLSSYPSPKISHQTLERLYELSALTPPEKGTARHISVKEDLEEMIRLVEAVRLVDTSSISLVGRGEMPDADRNVSYAEGSRGDGQSLLKHAARTQDQFYVVDSERKR